MVNGESSAEVQGLTQAFQGMRTVVAFANVMLCEGNVDVARKHYEAARILFRKLDNDRGVRLDEWPLSFSLGRNKERSTPSGQHTFNIYCI